MTLKENLTVFFLFTMTMYLTKLVKFMVINSHHGHSPERSVWIRASSKDTHHSK